MNNKLSSLSMAPQKHRWKQHWSAIQKDKLLYLMAIPGIIYFTIFHYLPMGGLSIAFMKFNIYKGIAGSPWVGMSNFTRLFNMYGFSEALYNTIIISLGKIVFGFPLPIIFAIALNELKNSKFKKSIQTIVCLPHFISWIVVQGLLYTLFSTSTGVIKDIARLIGYEGQIINLLASKEHFRKLIVVSDIWKGFGYGSILYIATISSIDPELYEASYIDGAGKLKQICHITLPGLRSTITIMLIMRVGMILSAGFDQIYAITNPMVTEVSEILDTFVYKLGITRQDFSRATAAGLFKSVIGLILVLGTNFIVRKIDKDSALM
ncbi:MAG: ABC transporter permease [Christensenellales bacterium]|jgi:putative aldouronate transport system permease protein